MPSKCETLKDQLIERHSGDAEMAAGELIRLAQNHGFSGSNFIRIGKNDDPNKAIEELIDLFTRDSILKLLQSEK